MAKPKRRKGQNTRWIYCQQMMHKLDAAVHRSEHGLDDHEVEKLPPILDLPPELRQQILHTTIADDDLLITNLSGEAGKLSLVCRTFKQDMVWFLERWRRHREQVRAYQSGIFHDSIRDLLETTGIALGSLAPSYGKTIFTTDRKSQWIRAKERRFKAVSDAPFEAMERWRKKRLLVVERESLARRNSNWTYFNALRRDREHEKLSRKRQERIDLKRERRAARAQKLREKESERMMDMDRKSAGERGKEAAEGDERERLRRSYGGHYFDGISKVARQGKMRQFIEQSGRVGGREKLQQSERPSAATPLVKAVLCNKRMWIFPRSKTEWGRIGRYAYSVQQSDYGILHWFPHNLGFQAVLIHATSAFRRRSISFVSSPCGLHA